jgi:hypothetical protein
MRTLAVLAALWQRLGDAQLPHSEALGYANALAPLAGSLTGRHSRVALCAALSALAGRLPEFGATAELLSRLNAMSSTAVRNASYMASVLI